MAKYYQPSELQELGKEVLQVGDSVLKLAAEWQEARASGKIESFALYLNDTMALSGIDRIRKLVREVRGKIEDAKVGLYRPRYTERPPEKTEAVKKSAQQRRK